MLFPSPTPLPNQCVALKPLCSCFVSALLLLLGSVPHHCVMRPHPHQCYPACSCACYCICIAAHALLCSQHYVPRSISPRPHTPTSPRGSTCMPMSPPRLPIPRGPSPSSKAHTTGHTSKLRLPFGATPSKSHQHHPDSLNFSDSPKSFKLQSPHFSAVHLSPARRRVCPCAYASYAHLCMRIHACAHLCTHRTHAHPAPTQHPPSTPNIQRRDSPPASRRRALCSRRRTLCPRRHRVDHAPCLGVPPCPGDTHATARLPSRCPSRPTNCSRAGRAVTSPCGQHVLAIALPARRHPRAPGSAVHLPQGRAACPTVRTRVSGPSLQGAG